MSGTLNIKNDRAVAALRRLAAHYGTNCTQAIMRAAEDILTGSDDEQMRREIARVESALAHYRTSATNLGGTDHGMYDENGLPVW